MNYNLQDELTKSVAEEVKKVMGLAEAKKKEDVNAADAKAIADHPVDKKKDPEQEKQVEGNEFTKAAAKAKLAGDEEFEFEGKTYPVEIGQEAAEKILGKNESTDALFASIDESLLQKVKDKLNPKKAKAREALAKLSGEIEKKQKKLSDIDREIRWVKARIEKAKTKKAEAPPEDKAEIEMDIEGDEGELGYLTDPEYGPKVEIHAEIDKIKAKMKEISTKFKVRTPTKESVEDEEELEEAVDNFFGFPTKDKLVKFQSMAKKLKIKPISNPTVLKRGGKEFHVMGFEGSVRDIEKAMKEADKIIKEETIEEAVDNFFGFPTKDKLVQFQSMAKKLKIKPISNPTVLKRGGKEFHVMGFEGSVSDIEKAIKAADKIIKE